jgi:HlyD family secretion protein
VSEQIKKPVRPRSKKRVMALLLTAGCLSVVSAMTAPPQTRAALMDAVRERIGGGTEVVASGASPARESVVAEGRFATYAGAEVVVSAEITGRLTAVRVVEGQTVRKGDLIAEISADELRASLAEGTARVAELDADLRLREWKANRVRQLAGTAAASAQESQEIQRDLEATRAQRESAIATTHRVAAQLDKARIVSPIDGTIVLRSAHPGQMVQTLSPIVTVADLARTRVEAEVNEFDGGRVRLGAPATVRAEGYAGEWPAVVEEIPNIVVNRALRPQDPGRPSDTGVVMVKLKLLSRAGLKLGQRVEIRIESTRDAAPAEVGS